VKRLSIELIQSIVRLAGGLLTAALIFSMTGCAEDVESLSLKTSEVKNYKEARRLLWTKLYPDGGETLYCGEDFDSQFRKGFNVEHVFPMSWVTNGLNCGSRKQCRSRSLEFNLIEADFHNLYPSRADVNKERSSFRFGDVRGESRKFGRRCDFEVDYRARVAEPAPAVRGEVARSMFYMAYTYKKQGLELFEKQARLLLKWHQADPPTTAEKKRNDAIEKINGRRNLFIDQPEKIEQLMSAGYFF